MLFNRNVCAYALKYSMWREGGVQLYTVVHLALYLLLNTAPLVRQEQISSNYTIQWCYLFYHWAEFDPLKGSTALMTWYLLALLLQTKASEKCEFVMLWIKKGHISICLSVHWLPDLTLQSLTSENIMNNFPAFPVFLKQDNKLYYQFYLMVRICVIACKTNPFVFMFKCGTCAHVLWL